MVTEVEQLITEQKESNRSLEFLTDSQELLESIHLESEITNEGIGSLAQSIDDLTAGLSSQIKLLNTSVMKASDSANELFQTEAPMTQLAAQTGQEVTRIDAPITNVESPVVSPITNVESPIVDVASPAVEIPEQETTAISEMKPLALDPSVTDQLQGLFSPGEQATFTQNDALTNRIHGEEQFQDLEETSDQSLSHLKSIDETLANNLRLQEEAADLAKVSEVGDEKEPPTATEGLGGLFKNLPPGAMKLLKAGGVAAIVAGGVAFVADMWSAFNDPKVFTDIAGKSKENLEAFEQSAVIFSKAVSDFSFGFLDAKDVYAASKDAMDLLTTGFNEIFDPEIGILGNVTSALFNLLEGNFDVALDQVMEIPGRFIDKTVEWIKALFDIDLGEGVAKISEAVSDVTSKATESVKSFFGFGDDEEEEKQKATIKKVKTEITKEQAAPQEIAPIFKAITPDTEKAAATATPIARTVDAQRTVALSKQRMDDQNITVTAPEPKVVVVGQETKQERRVVRRTGTDDLMIGLMNAGTL